MRAKYFKKNTNSERGVGLIEYSIVVAFISTVTLASVQSYRLTLIHNVVDSINSIQNAGRPPIPGMVCIDGINASCPGR